MMQIAAMILCLVALCVPAIAQDNPDEAKGVQRLLQLGVFAPPDLPGGNAAVEWCKLWSRLSQRQFRLFEDFALEYKLGDPVAEPCRRFLQENQQFLDDAMVVAAMPQCDWGLKSSGAENRTPVDAHLSYLLPVQRMLTMDAQRCLEDGHLSDGVDRLIAALRCGRHFAKSSHISGTMVGARTCAATCAAFEYLLEKGKLDVAQARKILSALREYPAVDPFGVAPAWRVQAQFTAKFYRTSSVGDHPMLRLLGAGHWTGLRTVMVPVAYAWSLTPDQFERDIQRFEAYYELVAKAMEKPGAEARLAELDEETSEGQHGITIAFITPAIDFVLLFEQQGRVALRRTREKLETYIARAGQAEPAK